MSAGQKANTKPEPTPQAEIVFPLKRINFIIMAVAAVMVVIGFCLIAGGGPGENGEFNPQVFSALRIVVGPTIAFLGFVVMGVGIMWTPKNLRDKNAPANNSKPTKVVTDNGML